MWRVGELADRRDRLLDRGPLGLGQLGIGEQRLAAEFAPEERLGEPGRRRRPENSSSSACRICLARSASSLSGAVGRSGAEVVVAMAGASSFALSGIGPWDVDPAPALQEF